MQITGNRAALPGKILGTGDSTRRAREKSLIILHDQPRASSPINDNYFVNSLQEGLLAGSRTLSREQTMNSVKCHVVKVVHSAPGHSQKRELSPGSAACYVQRNHRLKYVKSVSCVTQLSCVQTVTNVKNATQNLPVGARLQNFWQTWLDLGAGPKVVQILRGLHPPLSGPAKTHKVSHSHKLLCQSPQEPLPAGGITSAYRQKRSGTGAKSKISRVFQLTVFGPKTQQQVEAYTRSEQTKSLPQGGEIQNGDTGNHQNIPPTRGMGHLNRLQGLLLPYTNTGTIQ